jgi:hypothetical protein
MPNLIRPAVISAPFARDCSEPGSLFNQVREFQSEAPLLPNLIRPVSARSSAALAGEPDSSLSSRRGALFPNLIRPVSGRSSTAPAGEPDSSLSSRSDALFPNLVRSLNQVREFPSRRTA